MSNPVLRRCLGTGAVTLLAVSVATPAFSAFVIVPGMLQVAGTGAVWALLIAGVVCVATALIIVTGLFLAVEAATLLAVTALGLSGATRPAAAFLVRPIVATATGLVPASAASIGVATSIAIFALNGYGAAVNFAEEMHEAPRRIARAILIALAATLVLEGAPILAGLAGAPDLRGFLSGDDPFGRLVAGRAGRGAASWVAIGVTVAIVNAIIAAILATARFFYASARDRSWSRPLDRWLGAISPRLGTPWSPRCSPARSASPPVSRRSACCSC